LTHVDPSGVAPYQRKDTSHVDAAMRPTSFEYDRDMKLVEFGVGGGWDHTPIMREGPFAVADLGITLLLMRADRDLRYLAEV
jgi:hypothetical protein